jgi:hypothetical protein
MQHKEVPADAVNQLYQDQIQSINAFRSQQVNAIFLVCVTFGLPSLVILLYRIKTFGLQPLLLLQVGVYLLTAAILVSRKHLSYQSRALILVILIFLLGIGGLLTWGLVGMGIPFLMAGCAITTVMFGSRAGILATGFSVFCIALVTLAVQCKIISFGFDLNTYAVSLLPWLLAIFGTALFTSIIVSSSGRLYNSLLDSIRALGSRTAVLQLTNRELEREIAKRQEVEVELRRYEEQLEEMVDQRTRELQQALANVKMLTGMLPICAACKNIRDDEGYWHQVESYIKSHTEVEFSHGICPDCATKLYPELIL